MRTWLPALVVAALAGCAAQLPAPHLAGPTPPAALPGWQPESVFFDCPDGPSNTTCPTQLPVQGLAHSSVLAVDQATPGLLAMAYLVTADLPGPSSVGMNAHEDTMHLAMSRDDGASWSDGVVPDPDVAQFGIQGDAHARRYTAPGIAFSPPGLAFAFEDSTSGSYSMASSDGGTTWTNLTALHADANGGRDIAFVDGRLYHYGNGIDENLTVLGDDGVWHAFSPASNTTPICRDFTIPFPGALEVCGVLSRGTVNAGTVPSTDVAGLAVMHLNENNTYSLTMEFGGRSCYGLKAAQRPDHSIVVLADCATDIGKPVLGYVQSQWIVESNMTVRTVADPFEHMGPFDKSFGLFVRDARADASGNVHLLAFAFAPGPTPGVVRAQTIYVAWNPETGEILRDAVLSERLTAGNEPTGFGVLVAVYATAADLALARNAYDGSLVVDGLHAYMSWNTLSGVESQGLSLKPQA